MQYLQRVPESELAEDAQRQEFQSFECPQAVHLAIELDPADLLTQPGAKFLYLAGSCADPVGVTLQRGAVHFILDQYGRGKIAQRITLKFISHRLKEIYRELGARQVLMQID